jgi:hypothetical protein
MANVTYTVQNKVGSYDGDMVIKQYTSMTINSGDTVTVDQPCRGMFIYVQGDCTINGTLSMTAKGGLSNPTTSGGSDSNTVGTNGLRLGLVTSGGTESLTNDGTEFNGSGTGVRTAIANQSNISSNGTIFSISKDGANGGPSRVGPASGWGGSAGAAGSNGATGAATISTGGGGSGARWSGGDVGVSTSGAGGKGGCFSSGAGGGGAFEDNGTATAGAGGDYGGAGGAGASGSAGVGNPTGGAGGLIWLVVGGDITIGSSGSITAQGTAGNATTNNNGGTGGGGSGGGDIMILHAGSYTNTGSVTASGGAGGASAGGSSAAGGAGGAGGVHTAQVTF